MHVCTEFGTGPLSLFLRFRFALLVPYFFSFSVLLPLLPFYVLLDFLYTNFVVDVLYPYSLLRSSCRLLTFFNGKVSFEI